MFAFFLYKLPCPTVCVPFFCPSLILRSLSIPLLSFALLGDLLSLIFLLVGHFCSQELCCRINQVDFSIATLSKPLLLSFVTWTNVWKQRQTVGFSVGIITMMLQRGTKKTVCNSHHHVGLQPNVGLFLCSVGCLQKGSKQMMMDTFAHRITKAAYMLDIGHLSNKMRSKNAAPHSL